MRVVVVIQVHEERLEGADAGDALALEELLTIGNLALQEEADIRPQDAPHATVTDTVADAAQSVHDTICNDPRKIII